MARVTGRVDCFGVRKLAPVLPQAVKGRRTPGRSAVFFQCRKCDEKAAANFQYPSPVLVLQVKTEGFVGVVDGGSSQNDKSREHNYSGEGKPVSGDKAPGASGTEGEAPKPKKGKNRSEESLKKTAAAIPTASESDITANKNHQGLEIELFVNAQENQDPRQYPPHLPLVRNRFVCS
jgi:hypothetical protein